MRAQTRIIQLFSGHRAVPLKEGDLVTYTLAFPRVRMDQKTCKPLAALLMAIAICCFATFSSDNLLAQVGGEGAIQGRVVDPTGAVIPNATVTATNNATGVVDTRKATGSGNYVISPLPPGQYTVKATARGFTTTVQQNVTVAATATTALDLQLKVGAASQTVTVSSAPPMLDKTDGTISDTMSNKEYSSLPLSMGGQQRDPTSFIYQMPGESGGGRSGVANGQGSASGLSDGQSAELYMDGIPLETASQGDNRTVNLSVSVDAVNQFQVLTSSSPVEFSGLGSQNYVIKSGTNKYHGSAYDYIRNTAFDSWGFFNKGLTTTNAAGQTIPAPKTPEHQNEFGVTFGGPVIHNKIFFFASYDRFHYTTKFGANLVTVPTVAERTGDFSAYPEPIYDPTTLGACTAASGGVPCTYQFPNNIIPSGEISPIAQYMEKFLPAPTNSSLSNNFLYAAPEGAANWEFTGRVDANITPKQKVSFIVNSGRRGFIGLDYGSDSVLPPPYTNAFSVPETTTTGIVEDTYVLSPRLINQLKYAYIRFVGSPVNPWSGVKQYEAGPAGVGIGGLPPGQASDTFPNVTFSGGVDAPLTWTSRNGYTQAQNTYDILDNMQWSHGRHTITFGGIYEWINNNGSNFNTATPPLDLSESNDTTSGYQNGTLNSGQTGAPFASFLIGAVNSSSMTIQPFSTLGMRWRVFAPYAQDDLRATSKLSVNFGLRWNFDSPYNEVQNRFSYMNPLMINPVTGTPGALEFAGHGIDSCNCSTPIHYFLGNAAPRVGFAYSVGDKTVVRGGFGINYTHQGGVGGRENLNNATGQAGFDATTSYLPADSGGIPAFYLNPNLGAFSNTSLPPYSTAPDISPTVNTGNYVDAQGNAFSASSVTYGDPVLGGRPPYSETWNFGVQHALTNQMTVTLDYAASESHFLPGNLALRGYWRNQLDPRYLVLGGLLKKYPNDIDSKTGSTYLQEAQAILPGIQIPYANFGGKQATIEQMLLPFPQYSGVSDPWGDVANSSYNSLQFTIAQRTTHGLSFNFNYTWSKLLDNTGDIRSGYDIPANVIATGRSWKQDSIDRAEEGSPQNWHFFGVYSLPFGKGKFGNGNMAARWLAGGWSLSWIADYGGGSPIEITSSGCTAVGQGTCFPNYAPGFTGSVRENGHWGHGVTHANANTVKFMNAAAFTTPNDPNNYQIGDVSRTAPYGLFGPGGYNIDAGLSRTFPITERINFVFNAEAFNVTNTVQFGGINTNPTSSTFGTVGRQSNSPRDWQFAGRLNF
jgi:hypothetical protein